MEGPGKGKGEKRGKEGGGVSTRQGRARMGSAGRCF